MLQVLRNLRQKRQRAAFVLFYAYVTVARGSAQRGMEHSDMSGENDYHDIPGTTVFDTRQSRAGYHLNMFCMSLMKADNRAAFKADEAAYMAGFAMSDDQRAAVRARDYNWMISLGGNIYYLSKLGATDGRSFQQLAASMTGMSQDEYAKMMLAGGRSIAGNRTKAEWAKTHG